MNRNKLQMLVFAAFCLSFFALGLVPAAHGASENDFSGAVQQRDVPNWAVGTFRARNPETGGTITLTIERNGNVTVNFDGNITYATYDEERLIVNGVRSRVRRIDNGIRTIRIDNGERIDYTRVNGGGGGGGYVPSWAVGTFYGRNPQTGGTITLSVNQNGNVTIDFGAGAVTYATFDNDRINVNGVTSRVTRINDGIRTTRLDNGERIDYTRSGYGGGGGGNVPSWAVGTFDARNPETGGNITLTIQRNGNVTVDFDGNITYATINGDTMTVNGISSRVTRTNRGIRTTRLDNGERINYRRR